LPQALTTVLICQLYPVGAVFSNTTVTAAATDSNIGTRATHAFTVVGATGICVGPTPPTGLSFPANTWMEVLAIASGPTTTKYDLETGEGEHIHIPFTATGPTTLWTTYKWADYPQIQPYTDPPSCCGQCTVYFSRVEVNYWPVPGANTACLNSAIGSNKIASSLATVPPSNNSVSTTVGPDGFTYTSPSVYLAYHDISASNRCGQVGPKHTSVTVAVNPGQLSTQFANVTEYGGPGGQIASFDLKQLPCPPQSLIDAQRSAVWPGFKFHLEENEWAPIIEPPPYIQSLEPAWALCASEYVLDLRGLLPRLPLWSLRRLPQMIQNRRPPVRCRALRFTRLHCQHLLQLVQTKRILQVRRLTQELPETQQPLTTGHLPLIQKTLQKLEAPGPATF